VEAVGAVDDEPSVVDAESHGSEDPRMAPPPPREKWSSRKLGGWGPDLQPAALGGPPRPRHRTSSVPDGPLDADQRAVPVDVADTKIVNLDSHVATPVAE
jgi:hypothetical protein